MLPIPAVRFLPGQRNGVDHLTAGQGNFKQKIVHIGSDTDSSDFGKIVRALQLSILLWEQELLVICPCYTFYTSNIAARLAIIKYPFSMFSYTCNE